MAKQPAKGRKTPAEPKNAANSGEVTPESVAAVPPMVDAIPPEVHAKAAPSVPSVKPSETMKTAQTAEESKPADKPKAPETPKPAAPAPQKSQSGGFFPLALGGLVAGVIGFAVASFTAPAADMTLVDQVSAQATQISRLEQRIDATPQVDLSGVEAAQADLAGQVSDMMARIDELEARPATTVISEAAGEGVSAEMDALRAQIAEMTNAAQTELAEARAQAASIEENAAAAARNAAARAALSRVQTALESGAPIGAALGDLEAATAESAPTELLAVQDGVPTLASLQDQFPEVARAALATARSEGVAGEETTGFGAFLRNQLDVRSTTPREGDSADAILSRAEAAVRSGRLSDALAEISALPEVARAEMSDWLAQAEQRADAIAAVDILSTSLSDN
ncbi:MAG: COG4223 family protein [Yoonia sp.]